MIVNDNIKIIRKLSGKKQAEFAAALGISVSNLKSYENMGVCPRLPVLLKIAVMSGKSLENLQTVPIDPQEPLGQTSDKKDNFLDRIDGRANRGGESNSEREQYLRVLESNDKFFKDQFSIYSEQIIANLTVLQKQGNRMETLLQRTIGHENAGVLSTSTDGA